MSEEESETITSSSSEEEDEDAKELTLDVEKRFLKTLQSLKTKDPAIYDANVKFFDEETEKPDEPPKEKSKQKKAKPFLLSDYDRLLVKAGGEISEEADVQPSYNEEQEVIKSNLKKALHSDDSDDDSSLLTLKHKAKSETAKDSSDEETEIKHWLTGAKEELKDKKLEEELKPLHDIWTNPELDDGETFLRDYILNKRYLDDAPKKLASESEDSSADESDFDEKQEEFEHKYNFRFEEPDQEFIKRYPRTMEASMRRKESKRKLQREQAKRNREEKLEKKKGEMKKLKSEKREEILNHLKHLKSLTGNQTLAFKDDMLQGDFDPDQHDKIMEAMFNEEFYAGQDEEKPVFEDDGDEYDYPEYEDDVEGENNEEEWAHNGSGEECENGAQDEYYGEFTANGELITDCDYTPTTRKLSRAKLKRLKRKEKKSAANGPLAGAGQKSLFAQAVERPKPVFNPKDETFMKYVDEYYGLEFEDLIGDLPCRFKYKRVVPNSYGLSVEEILAADDKELNKWCPVKKIYSQRSEHVEKNEVKVYNQRASDEQLKRKLLPSLYKPPEEVEEEEEAQRILPTEEERKELMNKRQKKIQQVSEAFEKEKKNTKKIGDDYEEKGNVEKDDLIDETMVNEYLKEKKRNAKAVKRKLDSSKVKSSQESGRNSKEGVKNSKESGTNSKGSVINSKESGTNSSKGSFKNSKESVEVDRACESSKDIVDGGTFKKKKKKNDGTAGRNGSETDDGVNKKLEINTMETKSKNSKEKKTSICKEDAENVGSNSLDGKAVNEKVKKKEVIGNSDEPVANGMNAQEGGKKKKRKRKKKKKDVEENGDIPGENGVNTQEEGKKKKKKRKKKKKKKTSVANGENRDGDLDEAMEGGKIEKAKGDKMKTVGDNTKKGNDKKKQMGDTAIGKTSKGTNETGSKRNKEENGKKQIDRKKKALQKKIQEKQGGRGMKFGRGDKKNADKYKRKSTEKVTELSDARLKAYGINPKKFKSKLLYGNKDKEKA